MLKEQKSSPTAQVSKNCWDFQLWETFVLRSSASTRRKSARIFRQFAIFELRQVGR